MYTSSLQPLSCCNKAPSENWILKSEKLLFSPVVARPSRNIANSSTSPCPRTLTCWDRCSNLDTHPTVQHLRKTVRQKGQNTSKCNMEFVMVCELWSHQQKKNQRQPPMFQALDSLGSRSGPFALKISSWKISAIGPWIRDVTDSEVQCWWPYLGWSLGWFSRRGQNWSLTVFPGQLTGREIWNLVGKTSDAVAFLFGCIDGSFRSVLLDHLIVRGWVM